MPLKDKVKAAEYAKKHRETHKEFYKNYLKEYGKNPKRKEYLKNYNKYRRDKTKKYPSYKKTKEYIEKYNKKYPEKINARQKLHYAVKVGKIIKPLKCEDCKKIIKIEAHHTDYSKPLEVVWLCRQCHENRHHSE